MQGGSLRPGATRQELHGESGAGINREGRYVRSGDREISRIRAILGDRAKDQIRGSGVFDGEC